MRPGQGNFPAEEALATSRELGVWPLIERVLCRRELLWA